MVGSPDAAARPPGVHPGPSTQLLGHLVPVVELLWAYAFTSTKGGDNSTYLMRVWGKFKGVHCEAVRTVPGLKEARGRVFL